VASGVVADRVDDGLDRFDVPNGFDVLDLDPVAWLPDFAVDA
jgi:hypothetical protein